MKAKLICGVAAIGLLLIEIPAMAHHSFAAEFDENKPVKVEGVVTSMRWSEPACLGCTWTSRIRAAWLPIGPSSLVA